MNQLTTSLDAENEDEDKCSLMEYIPSDFDTFNEVVKRQEKEQYQDKIQQYISKLSRQQVNILNLLIDGYEPYEIREILELSERDYTSNMQIIRSYENVKMLF